MPPRRPRPHHPLRRSRRAPPRPRPRSPLARLQHPNIVTIHDSGQVDGMYYFVMEFIDGMDLRRMMGSGQLAPEQALTIVPPICGAWGPDWAGYEPCGAGVISRM